MTSIESYFLEQNSKLKPRQAQVGEHLNGLRRRAHRQNQHKTLKIALLGYRSHPHVGGQGIYLKHLSAALADLGHQITVFSGPPYPDLREDIRLEKVPSLDLYAADNHVTALRWRHLTSFTDFFEWWSMLSGGFPEPYTFGRRIYKKLKNSDFDVIHDNQCLAYGIKKLQKTHTVVTTIHHPIHIDRDIAVSEAHNWVFRMLARRWYRFLNMQESVAKKLRHLVTVSEASAEDIKEKFCINKPPVVIHNGVDTAIFKPNIHFKKTQYQLLCTVSSEQPMKGLSVLLHALVKVKQHFPETHLLIIGKLKSEGPTEKLIEKLNIEECISFQSGISEAQLVQCYNEASVAICPALYEGFGLPALEALACGTPLVSSDGGALPEVVGKAAKLVTAGNADAMAKAIIDLFQNPELAKKYSQLGRQRACDFFSWQKVAKRLHDYYHTLIHANNSI